MNGLPWHRRGRLTPLCAFYGSVKRRGPAHGRRTLPSITGPRQRIPHGPDLSAFNEILPKKNVNKILSNSFDFKRPVKGKRSIKRRPSDWRPATRSRDSSLSAEKKSVWHWNEGSWAAFMNDSGSYFPVFKRLMSVRVSRTSDKQAFKQSH